MIIDSMSIYTGQPHEIEWIATSPHVKAAMDLVVDVEEDDASEIESSCLKDESISDELTILFDL